MNADKLQSVLLFIFALAMALVGALLWRHDGGIAFAFFLIGGFAFGSAYATWKRPLRRGWRRW